MNKPDCRIDPKLFVKDMKFLNYVGYDPYNSHDALAQLQEDVREAEPALVAASIDPTDF